MRRRCRGRALSTCFHCPIFSTAIESFILGPVVGHYRPSGHYLGTADDIKQIGASVTSVRSAGKVSLSRDISHSRSRFAVRTELAIKRHLERSCSRVEPGAWLDRLDHASRSGFSAVADNRAPVQAQKINASAPLARSLPRQSTGTQAGRRRLAIIVRIGHSLYAEEADHPSRHRGHHTRQHRKSNRRCSR